MFMNNYSLNKKGIVGGAIKFLEKFDNSGKPLAERLEQMMSKEVSTDANVEFVLVSMERKFELNGISLSISPIINDKTMMIDNWVLVANGEPVILDDSYESLLTKMTALVLLNDEAQIKGFLGAIEKAVGSAR